MCVKMEKTRLENNKGALSWFKDRWAHNALFSTVFALVVMVLIQCIVMWINAGSFGGMFGKMGMAWLNILRNNATIGIIALGMTFVIITGGIDLAVGSTLVAIGAIIMLFIDGSQTGSSLVNQAKTWTGWEANAQIQRGFVHSEAHSAEDARQHEESKLAGGVSQSGRCS